MCPSNTDSSCFVTLCQACEEIKSIKMKYAQYQRRELSKSQEETQKKLGQPILYYHRKLGTSAGNKEI